MGILNIGLPLALFSLMTLWPRHGQSGRVADSKYLYGA